MAMYKEDQHKKNHNHNYTQQYKPIKCNDHNFKEIDNYYNDYEEEHINNYLKQNKPPRFQRKKKHHNARKIINLSNSSNEFEIPDYGYFAGENDTVFMDMDTNETNETNETKNNNDNDNNDFDIETESKNIIPEPSKKEKKYNKVENMCAYLKIAYNKCVEIFKPELINIEYVDNPDTTNTKTQNNIIKYFRANTELFDKIEIIYIIYNNIKLYCSPEEIKNTHFDVQEWYKLAKLNSDNFTIDFNDLYNELHKRYIHLTEIHKYNLLDFNKIYKYKNNYGMLLKYYFKNINTINTIDKIYPLFKSISKYSHPQTLISMPFKYENWSKYTENVLNTQKRLIIHQLTQDNPKYYESSCIYTPEELQNYSFNDLENLKKKFDSYISIMEDIYKYIPRINSIESKFPKFEKTKIQIDKNILTFDNINDLVSNNMLESLRNSYIKYNSIEYMIDSINKLEKKLNIEPKPLYDMTYDEIINYKNILNREDEFPISYDITSTVSSIKFASHNNCICYECLKKGNKYEYNNWDTNFNMLQFDKKPAIKNIITRIRQIYSDNDIAAADPMTFIDEYKDNIPLWLKYLSAVKNEYE